MCDRIFLLVSTGHELKLKILISLIISVTINKMKTTKVFQKQQNELTITMFHDFWNKSNALI